MVVLKTTFPYNSMRKGIKVCENRSSKYLYLSGICVSTWVFLAPVFEFVIDEVEEMGRARLLN